MGLQDDMRMVIWLLASLTAFTALALAQGQAVQIRINEGETSNLSSPLLAASAAATPQIQVVRVVDLTSQGCEGGPRACPDRADVVVSVGAQKQAFTLFIAHTAAQRQQESNKKTTFGFDVVLSDVQGKSATFLVQKAAPPANPKNKK